MTVKSLICDKLKPLSNPIFYNQICVCGRVHACMRVHEWERGTEGTVKAQESKFLGIMSHF